MTADNQKKRDICAASRAADSYPASRDARRTLLLASIAAYLFIFVVLHRYQGTGISVVALLPVVTAAWFYGLRGGVIAAVLALPANMAMAYLLEIDWFLGMVWKGAGIEGSLAIILIGAVVGRISYLRMRLAAELRERDLLEHELQRHRQRLEEMVQAKTVELSATNQQLLANNRELARSEARLRSVMDTTVDAIISTDSAGTIITWNKGAENLFGYRAQEVLGNPIGMLLPERFRDKNRARLQELMREPQLGILYRQVEGVCIRRDGTEFPSEVSQAVWGDGGELFATGIVRDISERKRAETALREREARFQAIVETAVDAIITVDPSGTIVFWNKAAENIFGYSVQEVLGRNISLLLPERLRSTEQQHISDVLQKGVAKNSFDAVNLRKDGSEFPVEVTRALWSIGGKLHVTAVVRDVTERKRAEQERLLLSSAIDQAQESITIMDARGAVIYANPAMQQQWGYPLEKVLGKNAFTLPQPVYDQQFYNRIFKQLKEGKHWKGDLTYKRADGSLRNCEQRLSPIMDEDGQLINILSVAQDITRERDLEEQLHQAQKMESIGTLAGGIAHDFNNILTGIMGYTELAVDMLSGNKPALDCLNQALKASHRARELVKQILTFSRKTPHDRKPVQPSILIRETIRLLRASLPATVDIRTQIDAESAVVEADSAQLHQLLINLCTNAAQAMEQDGGVLEICLKSLGMDDDSRAVCPALAPGPCVELIVRDTGPGIAPEIAERIFDPFFTTKEVGKGTGMGLAVVHGIVNNHGGYIRVDSAPGQGAAFHVVLPCVTNGQPVPQVQSPHVVPRGTERILMVDDEVSVAAFVSDALSHLGYTVVSESDSLKALQTFTAQPQGFDCVLTDMTMPHMTGDVLARKILEVRPDVPVILCTGYSERLADTQAHDLGIAALLMKPLSIRELAVAVRSALDGQ